MRSKKNFVLFFLLLLVLIGGLFLVKNRSLKNKKSLINISELSEEFMEDYFDDIGKTNSNENKENMLIVISEGEIDESYGASKIIKAPNNQYMLQYDSSKDKEYALKELKKNKSLLSVEENGVYTVEDSYNSWGIERMALDYAIETAEVNIGSMQPVTVAVIDTGCDMSLFNKYYNGKITEFYNVLESSSVVMDDEYGHGTHVSGVIAEGTPSNVTIFPVKASGNGEMYYSDIIAAINYVVYYEKADVINMSFGGYNYSAALEQAIASSDEAKIINVAAAGNDNTDEKHYPSSFDTTISIASVDSNLYKSSFSNYGSDITFAAPGTNIKSILSNNTTISLESGNNDDDEHEILSGTSMAAPHAASAVAIVKSYNKSLNLKGVVKVLKKATIDLGEEGWDKYFGYGFISFENVHFCEDGYCDEYGVYENFDSSISGIELKYLVFTQYNYYSPTNLMGSVVKVTFSNGTSEDMLVSDLPNVEILNYSPTASGNQTVTIKSGSITTNIQVSNPNNYESGWEYESLSDDEVVITGYKSHGLEISRLYIPEEIDSKSVYSLADNVWFADLSDDFDLYEHLYLPTNFKRIGNYALSDSKIKYIYGDSTGVEIGSHALESSSIVSVDTTITKLESNAFKNARDLTYVNVSNGLSDIGDYAFYNCKNLIRVKKIKDSAFGYIERVGKYAFYNCVSLSSFQLSVIGDIEKYAFYNNFSLSSFSLTNAETIGDYAFYSSGISDAEFSVNLEVIKESSFENCKNLNSVGLTAGTVETRAFWNSNVEELIVDSNVESIADDAFAYTRIKNTYGVNGGTYTSVSGAGIIESESKKLIIGSTNGLNIPNYVTEIGDYAFIGNNTLENITLPISITKIGANSFKDCYNLSNVYIYNDDIEIGNNSFARSYDGEIVNSDLVFYVNRGSLGKQYAANHDIEYRYFDPDDIVVTDTKGSYSVGDTVSYDDVIVKAIYHEETDREEILGPISQNVGYYIIYQNGDKINAGDSYYVVNGRTSLGYEFTRNVLITVSGTTPKTIINPEITVADKTYDGTVSIFLSSITVSNLDSSDYSIVSASASNANAGQRVATIRLRLSNEKFAEYSFDNGEQEKEFAVNFQILKANLNVVDNSEDVTVKYDGNSHSINMSIEYDSGATIKYMDDNDEYTLDQIPSYISVGTYVTKYKVYLNNNYNTYYGEHTLIIEDEDVPPYVINDYDCDTETNYISGIGINTTVEEFIENIQLASGYTVDVEYKTIDNKHVLYTGGKTRIYHGNTIYVEFTNVVSGDTNGDGKINSADLLKIRQHLLSINTLSEAYFLASDINDDGVINSADLLRVRQHLLGTKLIG